MYCVAVKQEKKIGKHLLSVPIVYVHNIVYRIIYIVSNHTRKHKVFKKKHLLPHNGVVSYKTIVAGYFAFSFNNNYFQLS